MDLVVEYNSLLNFINFGELGLMDNAYYPFDTYNLPYAICYRLWEVLGGTIAWLLNLLFPDNGVSRWLIGEGASTLFALILFMQNLDAPDVLQGYIRDIFTNGLVTCSVIFMLAVGATFPLFLFIKRAFSMTRRGK